MELVERLLGAPVVAERPVAGGYTPASNRVVTLADGRTAFVKTAVDKLTRGWLRAEQRVYAEVRGEFLPRCLGAGEDVLVLEDLSAAFWPPPWSRERIAAVRRALAQMRAVPPPPGFPVPDEVDDLRGGWRTVAADPAPFLALGVVSAEWLERALDDL